MLIGEIKNIHISFEVTAYRLLQIYWRFGES